MKRPRFLRPDIRQRLWIALAALAVSTLFVGGVAWYALDRADQRLDQLHRQTLAEVARALRLSKQSSDIATSAPFLLNVSSQYLIEREGQMLAETLDQIATDWPSEARREGAQVYAFTQEIAAAISVMKTAIGELALTAETLNQERSRAQELLVSLRHTEARLHNHASNQRLTEVERHQWLSLQGMANELVRAGLAHNLMSVGEYRRNYQNLLRGLSRPASPLIRRTLAQMQTRANAPEGLFETRRKELARQLEAQNALFRIRRNATVINELSAEFAANAEQFLARERVETASTIAFAKAVILLLGLSSVALALTSAIYVSSYVTGNIRAISAAMLRLAEGDRSTELRRRRTGDDEIGKLHHSFRVFRANALRLDRSYRRLNRQNALFEKVFLNISDGVAITDDHGNITAVNPNFAATLRLAPDVPLTGNRPEDLLAQSPIFATLPDLTPHPGGFVELAGADGTVLDLRRSHLPDGGMVWLFHDATERRRIEERLHQIQHIEALGKVSGEVAHDFGNVLSSVAANLHLIEQQSTCDNPFVDRMRNALDMGTALVQRLLAFARKQQLEPEVIDLSELVAGLSDLIGIGLKEQVTLDTQLPDGPLHVRVDPGQLESAVLNLCLNSNHAIEDAGQITLSVQSRPNDQAVVTVGDSGTGMDPATLARAFEPFFTARPDGTGTGLGLPMVYGFMKQSGGDVEIDSTPEHGTEIRLVFPLAQAETQPASPAGRALLVEDDAMAQAHAQRQLQVAGFTVHPVSSFDAAAEAIATGGYDLLLTDLHLGTDQTGWPLVAQSRAHHPAVPVIVLSGRLPQIHPYSDGQDPLVTCLPKPLTSEALDLALDPKLAPKTSQHARSVQP